MHFPTDSTAHTTAFDVPVVDHWLEWKTANTSVRQDRSAMQKDPKLYSCDIVDNAAADNVNDHTDDDDIDSDDNMDEETEQ